MTTKRWGIVGSLNMGSADYVATAVLMDGHQRTEHTNVQSSFTPDGLNHSHGHPSKVAYRALIAINSGSDASHLIRAKFPHTHPIWDFVDIIVKTHKDGYLLYNAKAEEQERLGKKI